MKKLNFSFNKKQVHSLFEHVTLSQENDMAYDLKKILKEKIVKKRKKEFEIKWKYAAVVMDRFFLYLSLIYLVITVCAFVLSNKNLYQ